MPIINTVPHITLPHITMIILVISTNQSIIYVL